MALRISRANARVLERVDLYLEPMTISLVEGTNPAFPLELTVSIPNHGRLFTRLTREDLADMVDALTTYLDHLS